MIAALDDLDLLAAEIAVRAATSSAQSRRRGSPTHARLANPGADVLDMVVDVLIDVADGSHPDSPALGPLTAESVSLQL